MWVIVNFFAYFITAVTGCFLFLFFFNKLQDVLNVIQLNYLLKTIKIIEIIDVEQCKDACLRIKSHCQDLSALGFDCEWVSVNGKPQPVALLQLATAHGLCCLFRLNILKQIPEELQEILSDSKIIKLGISPTQDAKLLKQDYDTQVSSTLDLRFLFPNSSGLSSMAASEIGVSLNKHWRLRCSDWESPKLSDSQKDYAAKDAFVAIEIFKKWLVTKNKKLCLWQTKSHDILLKQFNLELSRYLNINFSVKQSSTTSVKAKAKTVNQNNSNYETKKAEKSRFITRKTPLYHNCFMHAPDGELLCSCDRRKAQWYVERGLAEVLPGEPYSIRLLFEPAARSGDTSGGRFYQHLKQNCCVVCGALDSYLKHSVIPKEYRKHFPSIMKDHQSHDVVLMCVCCHHIASQHNEVLRNALAIMCKAPISVSKVIHDRPIQEVKNSAKALLNSGDLIPQERKTVLENKVKKFYEVDNLTPEILQMSANLETKKIVNENEESHGLKVVNYFIQQGGGLTELELLWRTHFLDNMKPQFLPALWSITHNHERVTSLPNEKQV